MGSLSIWHWIIVIAVVLLLFGRGKISDLMGDVAGGIKAFKKGLAEDDDKPTDTAKRRAGEDHRPSGRRRGGVEDGNRRARRERTLLSVAGAAFVGSARPPRPTSRRR